ncbi:MAG: SUMF1/EgtB/PvdO family nonheme iron enzyme [Acidobacteriia bacterium]|nr:ergothioneine biosynthesis protein EgtB [Methyloceanibacter sp.]MCL6493072.1 SUMF1/EgtB/PvdO family nonheme iron enzyme [Terriglobia bacterium]
MIRPLPSSELIAALRDARARTLSLVADLDAEQLIGPKLEIVNPPLWEIGHIAWFYEYFVLRNLDGRPRSLPNADALYNSSKVAHERRWHLPLPSLGETLAYLARVEQKLIERLHSDFASEAETQLYLLGIYHEDMHGEALTYTRQTLGYPAPVFSEDKASPHANNEEVGPLRGDVEVPGGRFWLGAFPGGAFVFDNEKWAHPVEVRPFRIARAPVSNAEFLAFIEDGGYRQRRFWDEAGWQWRTEAAAEHPAYWVPQGGGRFAVRRFAALEPLAPNQPVMHVNCYEAMAWCRWAGRRLPSEAEWEMAAAADPDVLGKTAPSKRRYPWGDALPSRIHANLDGYALGPRDVGAYPAGDSAWGCRQMLGNVWEWTASRFEPYPGFSPDAYEDYSAPWFGSRMVLRGGSWATRARLITTTYRNFFTPERRDIFASFRTVAL